MAEPGLPDPVIREGARSPVDDRALEAALRKRVDGDGRPPRGTPGHGTARRSRERVRDSPRCQARVSEALALAGTGLLAVAVAAGLARKVRRETNR
ncbi:hypothetical protein ACH419_33085 [Streptomyces bobili]|uniref:hypothetical protein n=1 Tax=Streptomyces TaxID=1883 RepID=UPI00123E449D|nr:hypothetical protein [Streptomyces galilaeus]GGW75863.1 hypothetical protein GCM10010350_70890 [Streptomyces galilaeus]